MATSFKEEIQCGNEINQYDLTPYLVSPSSVQFIDTENNMKAQYIFHQLEEKSSVFHTPQVYQQLQLGKLETTCSLPLQDMPRYVKEIGGKMKWDKEKFGIISEEKEKKTYCKIGALTFNKCIKPFHAIVNAVVKPLFGQYGPCLNVTWKNIYEHNKIFGNILMSKLDPEGDINNFVLDQSKFFDCGVDFYSKWYKLTVDNNNKFTIVKQQLKPTEFLPSWMPNDKKKNNEATQLNFIIAVIFHGIDITKPTAIECNDELIKQSRWSLTVEPVFYLEI